MLKDALELARLRRQLPCPEELRRLRRCAGVSMDAVARELGVTAVAVLLWETGRRVPRDPTLLRRYLKILGEFAREGK